MRSGNGGTLPIMLKVDSNFTAYPAQEDDELFPNGIFEFNITRMLKYVAENPREVLLEVVAVSDFVQGLSDLDETHIDSVDITRPVLMAEIAPGIFNLIDGHHRVEKARRFGKESVWAYKLNVHQHLPFLTSKKAYLCYIEYWNSKMKGKRSPSTQSTNLEEANGEISHGNGGGTGARPTEIVKPEPRRGHSGPAETLFHPDVAQRS